MLIDWIARRYSLQMLILDRTTVAIFTQADPVFRKHLHADAEATYIADRVHEFSDKEVYINKTIEDLLEQCVCVLVLASKGYRFQFYPGRSYVSTEYVNNTFVPSGMQISNIDVFISIEKKTIIPRKNQK